MTKLKVTLTNIPNLIKLRFNGTIAQQNSLYGQFGGYETFDIEQKYVNMANSRCEQFLQRVAMAI